MYANIQTLEIHANLAKNFIIIWIYTTLELGELIVSFIDTRRCKIIGSNCVSKSETSRNLAKKNILFE